MEEIMKTRFFARCPLCSRRLPKGWLARSLITYRRWGYALAYVGRRQIMKAGDVFVGATNPSDAKQWVGEEAEALAALAAVLLYDLTVAGWQPAFLRTLGFEMVRRRIIEPVVEYVDRTTPAAQHVATAQPSGAAHWSAIGVNDIAPAPSAPMGTVRWKEIEP
jgi:hypothetical protein